MSETRATAGSFTPGLPSAEARPVSARQQVINLGDRVFYMITRCLGICVILLALLLVFNLFEGAWESIRRFFEDIFDERKGGGHVLLIWGVEDRVYHLGAKSAEQAIEAANSIE